MPVPCANVRYQVVHATGDIVAKGSTGQDGRTQRISVKATQATTTPGFSSPYPLFTTMHDGMERYTLQVWSQVVSAYVEPELHPDLKLAPRLVLPSVSVIAPPMQTQDVLLKRYLRVRFQFKQGNQPIVGAPFVAYTYDAAGRQIAARDLQGKPIKGNTNKHGDTGKLYTNDTAWFVFNLPGAEKMAYTSDAFEPCVMGADAVMYEVNVKSQVAVAAPGKGTVAKVSGKVSAPAVLNAQDEELLLLTPEVWKEFEAVSGHVESTFAGVHHARSTLAQALQGRSPEAIRQAEKDLNLAEDKVATMLNKDFAKKADLVEVVTFESYDKGGAAGDGSVRDRMGLRRRYLPRKKYEEYKQRRIMGVPTRLAMSVSVKAKHGNAAAEVVKAKGERSDRKAFDAAKFKESLSRITATAKYSGSVQTDPGVWDMIDLGGNQFSETVKKSESYSVDTAAQWMRCAAGAGASSELGWDPNKQRFKAQATANAQAKLILFEGKWVHTLSIPSTKGWQMNFGGMDLGAIVFQLACELYGFVGAKASMTGAVGVSYSGNKATVQPQARDRTDSLASNFDQTHGLPRADLGDPPGPNGAASRRVVPASLNETAPSDMNGMSVNAEAFAGVEGGLTPAGELHWLPPEQTKPVAFARLSLDVAVSAGAGASAQLNIYYAQGKFRVKASARLCWGVGAKGAIDFVVDAEGMLEFVKWVYYQLAHAGFKTLVYMAKDAFLALSQLLFMAIAKDSEIGQQLASSVGKISDSLDLVMNSLEKAENRHKLVKSINKKPAWLIYATPETRGMLLYALTRHDWATHWNDAPEVKYKGMDMQVHYLNDHKQAVINIMKCVKLRPEWSNVMQHMTIDGLKGGDPGKAEGDVMRFLNYGISLNPDLKGGVFDPLNDKPDSTPKDAQNTYLQDYLKHRSTLMGVYPKGYEVASLNEMDGAQLAMLDGQESPMFAAIDPQYLGIDREAAKTMLAMDHGSSAKQDQDEHMA
ncbi:DNA repair protein [Xanthomonas oryzae]|uniref:DNA repair protein n=1 Tax=Xanthomonas oryzae TaxID=347 RepID=UPI001F228432|nr:DNA repair protein [Xanthomonas oryzae]